MKNIIIKVVIIVLSILIGIFIGVIWCNKNNEKDINVPKYIYVKDSLKIDSLILEINNLDSINNYLKNNIKYNDSIVIIEKEKIKKLPLTDKVLFLKKKLEYYEKVY